MLLQIQPNYVAQFFDRSGSRGNSFDYHFKYQEQEKKIPKNFTIKKHSLNISQKGSKELRKRISNLWVLSPEKDYVTLSGKLIKRFRCSFLTLTLPTQQLWSDKRVKNVLNAFMQTFRNRGRVNYCWRLEYQKNGNAHIHIIWDVFEQAQIIQSTWNRLLARYGMLQGYSEKFSNMSLLTYARFRGKNVADVQKYWEEQTATGWINPPTINVQKINNTKKLNSYMSKYIVKPVKEDEELCAFIFERGNPGKMWGSSESLSKIEWTPVDEKDWPDLVQKLYKCPSVKVIEEKFVTIFLFYMSDLSWDLQLDLKEFIRGRAEFYDYFK